MNITLSINNTDQTLEAAPDMPLLWALRDLLGLTGTKYGCGVGVCGACTVHLDGMPIRACITPISTLAGKRVITIEGLAQISTVSVQPSTFVGQSLTQMHPLQRAWLAEDVPQCGYCQAGQIMSAAALLARAPRPTDAEIDAAMADNICRCGAYQRIRQAIHRAAKETGG